VHNSSPEYASAVSILKPFENKFLKKVMFFSNIIETPKSSRDGAGKKEKEKENFLNSFWTIL
jgi:hypothetical protein